MIHGQLVAIVDQKIDIAKNELQAAKEARDNETKSTVGDKHETGRAMMQAEQGRLMEQLSKAMELKNALDKLSLRKTHKVDIGSLVITNQENYFIGIGHGKLQVDGNNYFCISLASPIGQALHGKKVKDAVLFRKEELTVREIH